MTASRFRSHLGSTLTLATALSSFLVGCGNSVVGLWEGDLLGRHDEDLGTIRFALQVEGVGESSISGDDYNFESTATWAQTAQGVVTVVTTCKPADRMNTPNDCKGNITWVCELNKEEDGMSCTVPAREWTATLAQQ